jgi:hypothetical protein
MNGGGAAGTHPVGGAGTGPGRERLTLKETADYTRRAYCTVKEACLLYERTNGREGLRSEQPSGPNGRRFVHLADADAWMQRKTPARGSRRFRIA